MYTRRFRPTLDTLPSRVAPSDFGLTVSETAQLPESISEAATTITYYEPQLAAKEIEPKSFLD